MPAGMALICCVRLLNCVNWDPKYLLNGKKLSKPLYGIAWNRNGKVRKNHSVRISHVIPMKHLHSLPGTRLEEDGTVIGLEDIAAISGFQFEI